MATKDILKIAAKLALAVAAIGTGKKLAENANKDIKNLPQGGNGK